MNKESILNGFTKFTLGAMAIAFVAIIIIAVVVNMVGINSETTTTTRAFLIIIASVISYCMLLKFKVFKKISEFVNATAVN